MSSTCIICLWDREKEHFPFTCECPNFEGDSAGVNPWLKHKDAGWLHLGRFRAFSLLSYLASSYRSYLLTIGWLDEKIVYEDGELRCHL